MRVLAWAALLLFAPLADAQTMGMHQLGGRVADASRAPGEFTELILVVTRLCPSQVAVLPAEELPLAFALPPSLQVTGPDRVAFPSQVCVQQPRAAVSVTLQIHVGPAAAPGLQRFTATLEVPALMGAMGATQRLDQPLTLIVAGPQNYAAGQAVLGASHDAPAPTAALLLVGLALLARTRR